MEMLAQLARAQVLALALLHHPHFKCSKKRIEWVTIGHPAHTLTPNPAHWPRQGLLRNRTAVFFRDFVWLGRRRRARSARAALP